MIATDPSHINSPGPGGDPADVESVLFDPGDALTTGPSFFPDGSPMLPAPTPTCAGLDPRYAYLARRYDDRPATRGQLRRLARRQTDVEQAVIELDELVEKVERAIASRRAAG